MRQPRIKQLFLIGLLSLLFISGAQCSKNDDSESVSFADFHYTDLNAENEKFNQRLTEALVKAKEWKADATFFIFNMFFEGTTVASEMKPVFYFASYDEGFKNDYLVILNQDFSGIVETKEQSRLEEDQEKVFNEITPNEWKIGYLDALKIAESRGGSDFRSNHNDTLVALELSKNSFYGLEWGIYYSGLTDAGTRETLKMYLDPITGQTKNIKNE